MIRKLFLPMLVHMFIVWVVKNALFILPYLYRVSLDGDYLFKVDGTAISAWEYFLLLNYYKPDVYHLVVLVFLFVPLVELNYRYIHRKYSLGTAIGTSVLLGILFGISRILPWNQNAFFNKPFYVVEISLFYSGYALLYGIIRKYYYDRHHRRELLLQRSENELNALKAQINPHFFFNSLNYLYGTALNENAGRTAKGIDLLSDMMRYTVTGLKETFVPLTHELKFIEHYITLQRARLPERNSIQIDTRIDPYEGDMKIAPLLLLPFIENAFKYGVSIDHPCFIRIRITISGQDLRMEVKNRIITEHVEIKGSNTGLLNTRKRLDLLYDGRHSLVCEDTGSEYNVLLTLNLKDQ